MNRIPQRLSDANLTLSNGIQMPTLGLGVWEAREGEEVERAVLTALNTGYRLIDTAAIYGNETGVGRALANSPIRRDQVFITTKVWNADQGYERTLRAFDVSKAKLGLDYLDLYLIHWPMPARHLAADTWRALEHLYATKQVRAIGVSNFAPTHLEELLKTAHITPMVDQIELHPRLTQQETRDFCRTHEIAIESYSPLMRGGELLRDATISRIADHHRKSPAQVVIRWHLQHGFIVIPKSVTPERIKQNADVFNFNLSSSEMAAINALNRDQRSGMDPDSTATNSFL